MELGAAVLLLPVDILLGGWSIGGAVLVFIITVDFLHGLQRVVKSSNQVR
jgi:hypothetical protein